MLHVLKSEVFSLGEGQAWGLGPLFLIFLDPPLLFTSHSAISYLTSYSPGGHNTGIFTLSIRHVGDIFTINSLIEVFIGKVAFTLV